MEEPEPPDSFDHTEVTVIRLGPDVQGVLW